MVWTSVLHTERELLCFTLPLFLGWFTRQLFGCWNPWSQREEHECNEAHSTRARSVHNQKWGQMMVRTRNAALCFFSSPCCSWFVCPLTTHQEASIPLQVKLQQASRVEKRKSLKELKVKDTKFGSRIWGWIRKVRGHVQVFAAACSVLQFPISWERTERRTERSEAQWTSRFHPSGVLHGVPVVLWLWPCAADIWWPSQNAAQCGCSQSPHTPCVTHVFFIQ